MTIRSKVHIGGHEHESEWPPREPSGEKGRFYIDPDTKELKEGFPPPRETFGTAPTVIFDSMPPEYHQSAGRIIESRKEWERADEETGSLTFGSKEQAKPKVDEYRVKHAAKQERLRAAKAAVQAWKADPKQAANKLRRRREEQAATAKKSGLDKIIKDAGIV